MPNLCHLGSDFPSREEVFEMQREQYERDKRLEIEESALLDYFANHPSASRAEAIYNSNAKRSRTGSTKAITCNRCGKPGLYWIATDVGWRLRDGKKLHTCKD